MCFARARYKIRDIYVGRARARTCVVLPRARRAPSTLLTTFPRLLKARCGAYGARRVRGVAFVQRGDHHDQEFVVVVVRTSRIPAVIVKHRVVRRPRFSEHSALELHYIFGLWTA